jgi:hypothetical protein
MELEDPSLLFSFLKETNYQVDLPTHLAKLLRLDLASTVSYLLAEDLLTRCIPILHSEELLCHRLLAHIFFESPAPNALKAHHTLQVKLVAKHDPERLMTFLKTSTHYNLEKAL